LYLSKVQILELVRKAKKNDQRAFDKLAKEFEPQLRKIATRWYIIGADQQDVMQEGRIGLWKAVQDFDETKNMSFRNFATNVCANRNVITAMWRAQRKKYDLHNNAISIDTPVATGPEDTDQSLADFISDHSSPLIDRVVAKEELDEVSTLVRKRLTQLEEAVYLEFMHDESYKVIAAALNVPPKAVDNALMRIRKKAAEVYRDYIAKMDGEMLDDDLEDENDELDDYDN